MSSRHLLSTLRRPAVVVGAVALSLGALTACGEKETKVDLGDGKSATVKEDGDEVSVTTDEGNITAGKDVTIPDDFPSDLPLLKADHAITSAVSGGEEKLLMIEAKDDVDLQAEHDHLTSEAEKAGWKVDSHTVMDQGDTGQVVIELSKDGLKAGYVISVAPDTPGTALITVSQAS